MVGEWDGEVSEVDVLVSRRVREDALSSMCPFDLAEGEAVRQKRD